MNYYIITGARPAARGGRDCLVSRSQMHKWSPLMRCVELAERITRCIFQGSGSRRSALVLLGVFRRYLHAGGAGARGSDARDASGSTDFKEICN
ncbi:hypothetical protein Zmor_008027 [Zophobas morio]|uniref:Uncharacterized protein n=1 Tax=Zophobas morio TaxID=2755281 RepID=A0AA38MQ47_9CUCU|nr:hypothetical protein Zmor_008027 [Zophobas morio]